jgi:protein-arginine kinase activator protein McsA
MLIAVGERCTNIAKRNLGEASIGYVIDTKDYAEAAILRDTIITLARGHIDGRK